MSHLFKLLFLSTSLVFISACKNNHHIKTDKFIEPLVTVQWLKTHLNDSDLVLLDTSVTINSDGKGGFNQVSGQEQYDLEHIPNAGFADLMGKLSAESDVDFIMPSAEQFQKAMSELGVGDNSRVVLYSSNNNVWAARLWWMLRWAGFDNVAILDGGLKAWKNQGFELSTDKVTRSPQKFSLSLRPEMIADRDEVFASINNNQIELYDAMPGPHYQGIFSMYSRPGHIVSAKSLPSSELVEDSGLFRALDEVDLLLDGQQQNRTITYCGGGVAASSLAFTLFRLGYKDVAVYMGSLQEWSANQENPMTVKE